MNARPLNLRVVGAGLPRTGTHSLLIALEQLLGGKCCHMSTIAGHPFNLGPGWGLALAGGQPDWSEVMAGYVASTDWPASMFWRELAAESPDALVLLSARDAASWWASAEATFLPYARLGLAPDWKEGRHLVQLVERFAGTRNWDDKATLMAAHDRHDAEVRRLAPRGRLLEWRAADGWEPICRALSVPVPATPFPWVNRREDWTN